MERREQHVPEKLVSSIYRLAPKETGYESKEEQERRLKVAMRRLVATWGVETVVNLIRKQPADTQQQEELKAWLVLSAWEADKKGQRQSS